MFYFVNMGVSIPHYEYHCLGGVGLRNEIAQPGISVVLVFGGAAAFELTATTTTLHNINMLLSSTHTTTSYY